MELLCELCTAKMPPKNKLVEIGGRYFLGSASILFDTTVYGDSLNRSWNMARFVLRIWQRRTCCIEVCIGSDGFYSNCLGVLSGTPLLAERFAYLNFRYLVAAFYRLSHPLTERLGVLEALNMDPCIRGYSDVWHWI
jgi:hypothetical protein